MKHFRKIQRIWHNLTHPIIGEVWEFHRVTNDYDAHNHYARYDVTPKRLESVILDHLKNGYKFVTIDEVYNHICGKAIMLKKWICITLDDGYRDNYENAYSIFQKYHIPFCIYVSTGYIDKKFTDRKDAPYSLSKQQLKELAADPLCTLGAHTVTHPDMSKLSKEDQQREITCCIEELEDIIKKKVQHFTIPFGAYNQYTFSLIKANGIKSNVFGWGGAIRKGEKYDPYFIPRIMIEETKKTF